MDERIIGALSAGAVIVGLAVMRALPPVAAARVQEGAKWSIAAAALLAGVGFWHDTGDPGVLVLASLIVAAWLGRRLLRSYRRAHQPEPRPPVQRERSG